MVDDYAALCGITEDELRTQMKPEFEAMVQTTGKTFEQVCAGLKQKYDGYHFSEKSPDIYKPFSVINALQDKKLTNYWFETGTPTYLMDWICKFGIDAELLKNGIASYTEDFNVPTEGNGNPILALYQSGYLTIKSYDESQFLPYTQAYPNGNVYVIVESERFVLNHAIIELEARGGKAFTATRVAAVGVTENQQ